MHQSTPDGLWHSGMRMRVLMPEAVSGGGLSLCHFSGPEYAATTVHRHEHEDEIVHVLTGVLDVWQQGRTTIVPPGGSIFLPRDVPHRLAVSPGAPAEFLCAFLPGGVERALTAASGSSADDALDPDDVAALLAGAGVSVFGWRTPEAGAGAGAENAAAPDAAAGAPDAELAPAAGPEPEAPTAALT